MTMKKLLLNLILITTLGGALLPAARGHAAPVAQATNLLQNPGFEGSFGNAGGAQNWDRWYRETPRTNDECLVAYHYAPKWSRETNQPFVHSGSNSQAIGNTWDTWSGGVYQTIPASPGTTYRFTFHGRARGSNKQVPEPSETGLNVNMRAGIDPNGSGNWADGDVVWGAAGSPHDTWQTFTVETTATGNQITVFTFVDWAVNGVNQCRGHMDTWYDTAEVVAMTPPTNTPAPLPTAAPATATSAAPTAAPATVAPTEPATTPTVPPPATAASPTPAGSSAICANAFLDANGNGLHDADEGFVGGVTLTVAQGSTIVGQAVSTGTESPICFTNLPAGTYQVGQTLPATLEMTTQGNATVDVADGQTMGLEFGSRLRDTAGEATAVAQVNATAAAAAAAGATATPAAGGETGTAGTGGTPGWVVGLGIAAILIGVVLLGTLLFMLLRR